MKKFFTLIVLLMTTAFAFANPSISEEIFFLEFTKLVKQSQDKLVLMNKKSNLAKLGEEEINGKISGTLHYKTKLEGIGCTITMTYTDYCDVDGWILNGQIITKANMKANGTLDGIVSVSGNQTGKIYHEKVILKNGNAGGGTYGVELDGKERKEIDFVKFFEALK